MMNSSAAPPSPARVAPNAWHAFGGIWRLTFRRFLAPGYLLGVAGMLVVLAVPLNAIIQVSNPKFYFQWTSGFYLTFLVPILAFLSGAAGMRDEMKPEAVDYVLTRPVRRPLFLIFKFLSHLVCVQLSYLLALAVVIAVGILRHIPLVLPALPWLLLGQVLTVTVFVAFGFLCGVLSARYLVIGLVYAGVVEFAIGSIPTQLSRLSMTHQVKMMLHPMLVWFTPALKPEQSVLTCVMVLLAFSVTMLAVAATVFSFQQLTGSRPNEG